MKRILCFLLAAVMLGGLCMTAAARTPSEDSAPSAEKAVVIVTLEAPALLDVCHQDKQPQKSFAQFLLSSEGRQAAEQIRLQQQAVRQQISRRWPEADFSASRSYTAVTNAFTVTVAADEAEQLCCIAGVRSTAVSSVLPDSPMAEEEPEASPDESLTAEEEPEASPDESLTAAEEPETAQENRDEPEEGGEASPEEPKEYDTYGMASKASIQVRAAYEKGFTGRHTLIAVIDNEFNVHHNVFSVPAPEGRYNKDMIEAVDRNIGFTISPLYAMEDIFFNGKIVFAYDYGEDDNDCQSGGIQHGTHVAGIAAGNNNGQGSLHFKGTAYDAQLALFKISDKSGTLKDDAIIAALDDAVKLEPDVINCSYGAIQYLTHYYEGRQLYEKLIAHGTAVVAAAGNDAYNSYAMGVDEVPVTYTNYSTVCSPSSMKGVLSTAASVPDAVYATHYAMVFNDDHRVPTTMIYANLSFEEVYENDLSVRQYGTAQDDAPDEDEEEMEEVDRVKYVYLDGIGLLSDFQGKKLTDKIVIVNESNIPLETLVRRSIQYHCYAVAVIRREKNSRLKQNSDISDFFVYSIDHTQKDYFERHPKGVVAICSGQQLKEEPQRHAGEITEYSSFGTRADLLLKPDITAPGDNILSSVDEQDFGVMSGTSMAAPCAAGAYAIMKQYIYAQSDTTMFIDGSVQEYIYQLLMSTAAVLSYRDTTPPLYYSPRLQGAGCIDLASALRTKAFLSVEQARPSVSLGESPDGRYCFRFAVTNFSSAEQRFTPDYMVQTDGSRPSAHEKERTVYVNSFVPENIRSHAAVSFSVGGVPVRTVVVPPYSTVEVETALTLEEAYVTAHSQRFANGFFVDGFIFLNSEEAVDLHLPFSGFCGDWSKAAVFPDNIYDDEAAFPAGQSTLAIVSSLDAASFFSELAGVNALGFDELPVNISFGRDSLRSYLHIPASVYVQPCVLLPHIHILRDVMDYTISIYDKKGILLFCENFGDISSYFNPFGLQSDYFTEPSRHTLLHQYAEFTDTLPEGEYTYVLSASTVGTDGNPQRREHFMFPIRVDNTPPVLQEYYLQKTEDGKIYLHLYAGDNNVLQGIRLSAIEYDNSHAIAARYDLREDMLSYWGGMDNLVDYHYDAASGRYYFRYDLTSYPLFIKSKINETAEVYSDGDVTVIFENETDYSGIEKNLLLAEAVDGAYRCSDGVVINIRDYGEARLRLTDETGAPLRGVWMTNGGRSYESDADGMVTLKNLPIGKNECYIPDEYVLTDSGRPYLTFDLTYKNYRYEGAFVLKAMTAPETSSDTPVQPTAQPTAQPTVSRYPTVIVNFHTGSRFGAGLLWTVIVWTVSGGVTYAAGRRKKRHGS